MVTIVNFSNGYYHTKLDDTIKSFNIFNTPFCRFGFSRMPFGLTVAGDEFQCKLDAVFSKHVKKHASNVLRILLA